MISRNDKGMAQIFNNLSHPPSFTLNQRAIASIQNVEAFVPCITAKLE
jgi:hypothetical protein